ELRYETGDQSDRLDMLHEIGRDVGRILEAVPGFTGALMNDVGSDALGHVRLTLSAGGFGALAVVRAEGAGGPASAAPSLPSRPPPPPCTHTPAPAGGCRPPHPHGVIGGHGVAGPAADPVRVGRSRERTVHGASQHVGGGHPPLPVS